ncbi:MAG: SpoVR family protein [Deltaproteobacteria bacterium]|nr:SpoVR family protein [Deltaproteobacteria bacterium]
MELINQHTKRIMEGCKDRAKEAGLQFQDETLEYIVTNKDLLELMPKNMIPTLYDYWVHEVEVLKEKGKYELYPYNPYETVINTRPAMSFYNDNNPDWLNVMIFYHVLAHIDFFQNNLFFKHTWQEDFAGQALSDKRSIALLRSEKGRFVDYVIEFTRGIDNLVGFYNELSDLNRPAGNKSAGKLDFYFDLFLQTIVRVPFHEYLKEVDRYNETTGRFGSMAESIFFSQVSKKYPEFEALYTTRQKSKKPKSRDLIDFIADHSPFLQKEENRWMKTVMEIVRKTSLYFQPQIRTKILNEGWASYWHEKLFINDDRIKGNEVAFARVNAKVTALPRMGLNPYALGMRLFSYLEGLADQGRISYAFQRLESIGGRSGFDQKTGQGRDFVSQVRENFNDFMFVNTFVDQDFVDTYKLFVAGKRLNPQKEVWEYYIQSRKASDYKAMLLESLYHPPHIVIGEPKSQDRSLYLDHQFEGKPLVREFIAHTLLGIEYLWGGPVKLETSEPIEKPEPPLAYSYNLYDPVPTDGKSSRQDKAQFGRVLYTMENRKLSRSLL